MVKEDLNLIGLGVQRHKTELLKDKQKSTHLPTAPANSTYNSDKTIRTERRRSSRGIKLHARAVRGVEPRLGPFQVLAGAPGHLHAGRFTSHGADVLVMEVNRTNQVCSSEHTKPSRTQVHTKRNIQLRADDGAANLMNNGKRHEFLYQFFICPNSGHYVARRYIGPADESE
ncbi:hypothetical protein EVAR_13798_1 [Eumeta japonica]|uniref:Uncharacterized protein n=1 Tax=Eumeta variegata TaxID=151549 RepID=A0A4C1U164_EUMVA|nr:hypothetical protein EVAR_13798_1 [Eumeta japonica]